MQMRHSASRRRTPGGRPFAPWRVGLLRTHTAVVETALVLALALLLLGATLGTFVFRLAREAFRFRGEHIVICPETGREARVGVRLLRAAAEALYGTNETELGRCTLWSEKGGCGQGCLRQIAPEPGLPERRGPDRSARAAR